ncbi:hypothetical protein [Microbulbifer sp. YPW1]|uniref:hypothetical protein n=1 Tax=Microbulbifer sp. YPW1 TaxID=2745199 RepID=UPI00159ADDA5|nr:hypothetical protein [Microbulbifer sp. YPW1]QKX17751.1 hypothetical protein HUW35_12635 [Microbulbifer sp. YPW1]
MSQYQQKYWSLIRELKTHVIYLHNYAARSEWWDKAINILLAITSSSSIAAWAIWQEYQLLWAVIIALSQVVTAIKPFLPFKQRLKPISDLNDQIQDISLDCERHWFSVAEGELTEKEIHDLYISLKDKSLKAEKKALKDLVLPKKKKILQEAEKEAEQYLVNTYY